MDTTAAQVLVPSLLLSNDVPLVDQPIPLAALIDGLAENHVLTTLGNSSPFARPSPRATEAAPLLRS
jgi:hypothetical protein